MHALSPCLFQLSEGRLQLQLRIIPQGRDLLVQLTGGTAHIGAVALAVPEQPGRPTGLLSRRGHHEDVLAVELAEQLSSALHCAVCVSAGIHYDCITAAEIAAVENMARRLTAQCLGHLTQQSTIPTPEGDHAAS